MRPAVERFLVTTGGGALQAAGVATAGALRDAYPAVDGRARARAVRDVRRPPEGVELVEAPASLLAALLAADIVVSAAGQSAFEAAATGAATVAVPLAPKQRPNAGRSQRSGAAVIAGPDDVVAAVGELDRAALAVRGSARGQRLRGATDRLADRAADHVRNSSSSRVTASGWSSARK